MKHQPHILTAAILLSLVAGSANAGVKDWLKDKKDMLKAQTTEQAAGPSDQERTECQAFLNSKAAQTDKVKRDHCASVMVAPKTLGTVEVKGQKRSVDKSKIEKGVGIGVQAGALVGGLLGNAEAGALVGGLIGGGVSYAKQMKQVREVEAAANAAGMKATVNTETGTDKGKAVEKLQGVVIEYDPTDMQRMDDKTRSVLDRLANLAKKSKNAMVFTFDGTAATCKIPMDHLKAAGVLDRHTVIDNCGKSARHAIVITPVPELD